MTRPLKLIAEDDEDLRILSAHLQDAVIRVPDLAYLPKSRRFALLASRFCWDDCPDAAADGEPGARVLTGLHFDGVLKVKTLNVERGDPNAVLQLLTIHFMPGDDGGGAIHLLLAGGGCIRLTVEGIDATLSDITEPWTARARPMHDLEGGRDPEDTHDREAGE